MRKSVRTAAFALLLLAVAALAYAPLFGAQYAAEDVPYLVRASTAAGRGASLAASALAGTDGPLARFSLRISAAIWTSEGRWTAASARWIRIENALLLLGAAAIGRLVLRRALAPWIGRDAARASAGAFALLLACHPACVSAVARAGARGDLLALCLGALSALLFLRGREERQPVQTVSAGLLAVLAGLSSPVALLLPPLLAVLELVSAKRKRPMSVRLRTSATTLVVFAACVGVEAIAAPAFRAPSSLARSLAVVARVSGIEGLARGFGTLAFPVTASPESSSAARATLQILAGALLLAAFQPALVAARSAPRLWAWLAALASAAFALALLVGMASGPGIGSAIETEVEGAGRAGPAYDVLRGLVPGAVVAACVLAVAASALSGARRVLIPAALASGFTVLAQIAAGPWQRAGESLGELQRDLADARAAHGGSAAYLVVDPPELHAAESHAAGSQAAGSLAAGLQAGVSDLDALREDESLDLLLDPSVCAGATQGDKAQVRGISREGLHAFAREPEFEELRRSKLVLLRALPTDESPRRATVLPPSAPSSTVGWRPGSPRSELFDLDPFERLALRAVALPTAPTTEPPRMGWRTGESETFSATGVWLAGAEGPIAFFDLSRCDPWLFGSRPQRAWLEQPVETIRPPEFTADAPEIGTRLEPSVSGGRWSFAVDAKSLPKPLHGEARFVLLLLDVRSLRYLQLEERSRGADPLVFEMPEPASARSTWAWCLDLRCGEACIARAHGRR